MTTLPKNKSTNPNSQEFDQQEQTESPRFASQKKQQTHHHDTVGLHGQSQHQFIKSSQKQPHPQQRFISNEELRQHISHKDAWISLDGIVYDVTSYLKHHPGGAEKLLEGCGKQSKKLFDQQHPWVSAKHLLKNVRIGYLIADQFQ